MNQRASVFFHIYLSSATQAMSSEELIALLRQCHTRNREYGISGILLYKGQNFMQLLEGREADVRNAIRRIAHDPRHQDIIPLLEGFEKERQYPDWTMAFLDLNNEEVWSLPGYSPFLYLPLTYESFAQEPTNAQKLILAFKTHIDRPPSGI